MRVPTRHLALEAGARVEVPFTPTGWIVERCTVEGFAAVLELRPAFAGAGALAAESGQMLHGAPDMGEITIALFEAPSMTEQSSEPTVLLPASSPDSAWRSAAVDVRVGSHEFAERTARRKSVLGRARTRLGPNDGWLEVELVDRNQWLLSCDHEALFEGANLAMLGHELLQFGAAESIGLGRFLLSQLVRGLGRTEWAMAQHTRGEAFVMLQRDALRPIPIPGWITASTIEATTRRRLGPAESKAMLPRARAGNHVKS